MIMIRDRFQLYHEFNCFFFAMNNVDNSVMSLQIYLQFLVRLFSHKIFTPHLHDFYKVSFLIFTQIPIKEHLSHSRRVNLLSFAFLKNETTRNVNWVDWHIKKVQVIGGAENLIAIVYCDQSIKDEFDENGRYK